MPWNWQHPKWPDFIYDEKSLQSLETAFLQQSGVLLGSLQFLTNDNQKQFAIDLIGDEAYHTSEIEGEMLNRDSLRSSIARHFGLKTLSQKIPAAEAGIADLMLDLLRH